ncbi:TetR/AcrR family transcriptional regulator [Corynebacterium sp. A21]|uniref:TetR/AcrR family transcriptional regulator n=1 Tax=Corynebacterium sp. A21 TaxID=3457318 RepID=UPI003FCEF60B
MSGLRESKKAATRSALARAAAELALREGSEGLTVAAIATAAGVSPRTFHNYFASREEALLEFISERIQTLVAGLAEVPAELSLLDAVEHLVVRNLQADDSEINSFGTLFRLSEIMEILSPAPGKPELNTVLDPLMPSLRPRFPELSDFEAAVAMQIIAAAIRTALEWHYSSPVPQDPAEGIALVHRACEMVRLRG